MSNLCKELHELMNAQRRFYYPWKNNDMPENGIFLMFENGEAAHGTDRIVMVGIHNVDGNLNSRLTQHYVNGNMGSSIFQKSIGRCIQNIRHTIKPDIEQEISAHIRENFSFCVLKVDGEEDRKYYKARLIATISQCKECNPSANWFGLHSPEAKIRESGLWQVQGLNGEQMTKEEFEYIQACIY